MSRTWQASAVAVLFGLVAPWSALAPAAAADKADRADRADRESSRADGTDRGVKAGKVADRAGRNGKARKDRKLAPGEMRRVEVVKAGWWWSLNEPPPETGLIAAPQPPSPTVPKGSMPVGAVGGDPEKVAAIELRLAAEEGSTVKSLEMVLQESAEPGANMNAEAARILACPVTELFWADGAGAAWKAQPAYDCTTKAVGERDEEGLWRFDLTEIAAGWLEVGSTESASVVLVEDVEAPESFEVAFTGAKDDGVGLALAATPPAGEDDTDDDDTDDGTSGSTGAGLGGGSTGGSSGGSLGGGGGSLAPADDGAAPEAGAPATDAAEPATEAAVVPVSSPPTWYSGIPRAGLLLVPLALGLGYLIMLALGPDARPVPTTGRHGVSRALDRLRQAGRDLRSAR